MNSSDMRWYCIHTKRYKESWVARQLMESCDETYLPLLRWQRTVRRQRKWVIEPLFPGYLFARFVVEERFRAVRYTPGVVSVVSTTSGGPIEVDAAILSTLLGRKPARKRLLPSCRSDKKSSFAKSWVRVISLFW